MKVLFIGGTGRISTAVCHEAVDRGMDLYVMNRGNHNEVLPEKAHPIIADINDEAAVEAALKDHTFDAVVDWVAFTPEHVKRDHRLFKGKTRQYVFISSASAYQKPLPKTPITEDVPLDNRYWDYSQNKAECEAYLNSVKGDDFHVTTIRPSHTYDETTLVFQLKSGAYPFTLIKRILERRPIVLPGDGSTLWTLTYNWDFAGAFLDVLGNEKAYDEAFHLTSEKVYTWNEINKAYYEALDIEPDILHIPLDFILSHFPEFEGELRGDKMANAVFDNTKIKAVAPNYRSKTEYPDIAKKVIAHYMSTPELQAIDEAFLERYDAMIEAYEALRNDCKGDLAFRIVLTDETHESIKPNATRAAARAIIFNDKGSLLMLRSNKGDYKFPGGGVEERETYEDTLKREVKEETGYTIEVGQYAGNVIEHRRDLYDPDRVFEMVSHYYECTLKGKRGIRALEGYEETLGLEVRWVQPLKALRANTEVSTKLPWVERENKVLKKLLKSMV